MEDDAETADLVLVIGTSLGGLSADQVPNDTAERSESDKPYLGRNGGALGAVIINLQAWDMRCGGGGGGYIGGRKYAN
jgi:hypothetical protein